MDMPLISVKNVHKNFNIKSALFSKEKISIKAVSDVTLDIKQGETLGLVGESGCGKSTLGRLIVRLLKNDSGQIFYRKENITQYEGEQLRKLRRKIQIIFQDPYASLNPRMTIGSIISEPLIIHKLRKTKKDRMDRVKELLEIVGLRLDAINRYPHEFSGGQRQRIGIARVLAVNPEFIVCDEPVSALDVSVQAQVVNLLMDLQDKFKLTYLFIAHDLKVVEHISNRVAVMYLGKIVELADSHDLYKYPQHPYTKALMSAIPAPDPKAKKEKIILPGDVSSSIDPPAGCPFNPRCNLADDSCKKEIPLLNKKRDRHLAACLKVPDIKKGIC